MGCSISKQSCRDYSYCESALMSTIKSTRLYDEHDCEVCGSDFAEGFQVTIDGESFGDYEPVAHCYDSKTYYFENVICDILKHFGHTVEVVN